MTIENNADNKEFLEFSVQKQDSEGLVTVSIPIEQSIDELEGNLTEIISNELVIGFRLFIPSSKIPSYLFLLLKDHPKLTALQFLPNSSSDAEVILSKVKY